MEAVKKIDVLCNIRAGAVRKAGAEEMESSLRDIFGSRAGAMMRTDGSDIPAVVAKWSARNAGGGRGLAVVGGDGTLKTVVDTLFDLNRADVAVGPLPGGSECVMAKVLGFRPTVPEAAAQFREAMVRDIDVCRINGMNCLIGATIDPYSAGIFRARESMRDKDSSAARKHVKAVLKGLLFGKKMKVRVSVPHGGRREAVFEARSLALSNNLLSPLRITDLSYPEDKHNYVARILNKERLDGGLAVFYALSGTPWCKEAWDGSFFRGILNGSWAGHKFVSSFAAAALRVDAVNPADKGRELDLILDGEERKTRFPLEVSMSRMRVFSPRA